MKKRCLYNELKMSGLQSTILDIFNFEAKITFSKIFTSLSSAKFIMSK